MGRFGKLDAEIMVSEDLSDNAKVIWAALRMFQNPKTGTCFPTQGKIAKATGKDRRTVNRGIAELKKWKKISMSGTNRNHQYRLLEPTTDLSQVESQPTTDLVPTYDRSVVAPTTDLVNSPHNGLKDKEKTTTTTTTTTEDEESSSKVFKKTLSDYFERIDGSPPDADEWEIIEFWQTEYSDDNILSCFQQIAMTGKKNLTDLIAYVAAMLKRIQKDTLTPPPSNGKYANKGYQFHRRDTIQDGTINITDPELRTAAVLAAGYIKDPDSHKPYAISDEDIAQAKKEQSHE